MKKTGLVKSFDAHRILCGLIVQITVLIALASSILLAAPAQPAAESSWADELVVLPEKIDGVPPCDMVYQYLVRQADKALDRWQADYEQRKTASQIVAYQKRLRGRFLEAIGGLPERTPLNPRVTGVVRRDGYRVEKVIFESRPHHYVTALLFLPESPRFPGPYPGVLVPCGHSRNGKASQAYQTMGALLALNGMAGLVFDPIDQGERGQLLNKEGKPLIWGTTGHTMVGVGNILLGRNTARFEIWDGMRAIDYLQSHPAVDASRIGCTGNSGGGTQTSYLMALDDRISAAAPSCYITGFERLLHTIGPQDAEQNIFGQLEFGMDHADYLMMRAPMPILLCTATLDFFDIRGTWQCFRFAKRLYTRLGVPERIDLLENDAKHNYAQPQREGALRWMARWLLRQDEPLTEPPVIILNDQEVQCTPRGQVMLLETARSVYDLNEDYENQLARRREQSWRTAEPAQLLDRVRQITSIRPLRELPQPKVEKLGRLNRPGCQIEKLILSPEDGIYLPALIFRPEHQPASGAVLYLHEDGKLAHAAPGGPIEQLVKDGNLVLALDLRGCGRTQPAARGGLAANFGPNWKNVFAAYLLARSFVQMRAEDILVAARYTAELNSAGHPEAVKLLAVGNVAVPALHAAALEGELFRSVKLIRPLLSFSNVIHTRMTKNQLVNTVHGALEVYDLPDLARVLGKKLEITDPIDAAGRPIQPI